MDASSNDPIYYPFNGTPSSSTPSVGDIKICSIRGCNQPITDDSNNKMCDACRSRHRVYATTKRARRKLEKVSSHSQQSTWVLTTGETYPQETLSDSHQQQSSIPPLPTTFTWDSSIDQQMFVGDSEASGSMVQHVLQPIMSSSSELANALTYPPPRIPLVSEAISQDQQLPQQVDTPSLSGEQDVAEIAFQYSSAPERNCSVKGCKAAIPASYDYKMCPPCRERYRNYGNTKRAKWKYERKAFEREMSTLRAAEEERRKANGLAPLADNAEELCAWESSIIDEEAPISPAGGGLSAGGSNEASGSTPSNSGSTSDTGGRPPTIPYPMVPLGVYPSSVDSPHAISPYPSTTEPLEARMCTVSHCHKILPGHYRYKRCEQHRLQNRYHSKLKRTREKGEKPDVSDENMEVSDKEIPVIPRLRKPKGEGRRTKAGGKSKEGITSNSGAATLFVKEYDPAVSEAEAVKKHSRYICGTLECHNLLFPGARWRSCEDCRTVAQRLKFLAKAEQKAAESQYWKSVSERMSSARALEGSGNIPIASGSGSGSREPTTASTAPAQYEETSNADGGGKGDHKDEGDSETDADGDAETDPDAVDEAQVVALVDEKPTAIAPGPPDPPQGRQLIWKITETGKPDSPPLWAKGYSKFRVALPPTPPPIPPRTAEELMKLDDPLTFKGFRPTTTPSAIGRILARNPNISVDAFSEILEADSTKPQGPSTSHTESPVDPVASKAVPTPTIPTSAPFVYKAPERKPAAQTSDSASGKGKGKEKEIQENSSASSSGSTSAPCNQIMALPPSPFTATPYGYPPSYPYYPYYHSPYQIPPYPYAGAEASVTPSNPVSLPLNSTSYYPYPYAPQAYGYPPTIPYVPPRYSAGVPNMAPTQQPYASYSSFPGTPGPLPYPYYPQLSTTPVPTPTPAPAPALAPPFTTKPTTFSKSTASGSKSPPVRVDIRKDGNFNHYHYGGEPSINITTPENVAERPKRRKVDPDYLAKYQAIIAAKAGGSMSNQAIKGLGAMSTNTGPAHTEVPLGAMAASPSENTGPEVFVQPSEDGQAQEPSSSQPSIRTCTSKNCQRSVTATVGNICERCKTRLKRRQVKTKKKFNLEPRKFLLDNGTNQTD